MLSAAHRTRLEAIAEPVLRSAMGSLAALEAAACEAGSHWDVNRPAKVVNAALRRSGLGTGPGARRSAVAAMALGLPERAARARLPESVTSLFPRMLDMLVPSLEESGEAYPADFYGKDVRIALLLSVPAGAQYVDLRSALGPKVVVRQLARRGGLPAAWHYLAAGGTRPWLQIHTDTRDVADFNESGWDACYARVAELLLRDEACAGMIGNSWFYDPALLAISPRLAYLQKPFGHGAFRIWSGSTALDRERAAAKSPTRKALIEQGTYVPTSYVLAWPRKALIGWARR